MSEFAFPVALSDDGRVKTLTAFNAAAAKPLFTANSTHPNWDSIVYGLRHGVPDVWDLFDVAGGIMRRFEAISDRYAWDGSNVLLDGDPLDSTFGNLLGRAMEDGDPENYTAIAKFGEKVLANPSEYSREQLYNWLASHEFQITADGDIVGYKGVHQTSEEGVYESSFTSQLAGAASAFVNGVPLPELSKVRQRVGDVVSLPRSEVIDDPSVSCGRGLHVATANYAKTWGLVMEVHVNPAHAVSVPNHECEKMRVHQYKVAKVKGDETRGPVLREGAPTWAGNVGYKV